MQIVPLAKLKESWPEGQALPWDVIDGTGTLLLAQGWQPCTQQLLEDLLERWAYAQLKRSPNAEGAGFSSAQQRSSPCEAYFFDQWARIHNKLFRLLAEAPAPGYEDRLVELAVELQQVVRQSPDECLFAIVRHDFQKLSLYGVTHSLHCAATAALLGPRLPWPAHERAALVQAALTMNVSIVRLQGVLATQRGALSQSQRELIRQHPLQSEKLLREAGVTNGLWLEMVAQHHEEEDARGYPLGLSSPVRGAQVLRLIDLFLAQHAPRASRPALPAAQAAQQVFSRHRQHPAVELLMKEFGLYPPGSAVCLASAECGLVLKRGKSLLTPLVAVLVSRQGEPLLEPRIRDTAKSEFAVVGPAKPQDIKVAVPPQRLYTALPLG